MAMPLKVLVQSLLTSKAAFAVHACVTDMVEAVMLDVKIVADEGDIVPLAVAVFQCALVHLELLLGGETLIASVASWMLGIHMILKSLIHCKLATARPTGIGRHC